MKALNRETLFCFIDLVDTLVKNPSEASNKVSGTNERRKGLFLSFSLSLSLLPFACKVLRDLVKVRR